MHQISTKEKILVEGRALLQTHGYNGFSFQHIADKLGIKKPSLYDHFSSKEALIVAIIARYNEQFLEWDKKIALFSPSEKIEKAFKIFHSFTTDKKKICPILALAADFQDLSKEIQASMDTFVEQWIDWLEDQILLGQKPNQNQKQFRKDIHARDLAKLVYSLGMGSQIQARIKNTPELPLVTSDQLLKLLQNP